MSRGGGAGRGGRGGYGPPGARLNHGTMPFEISPELMEQADRAKKEEGLWPEITVPRADPLSNLEMREVDAYLQLRAKFRIGPYYRQFPQGKGITKGGKRQNQLASLNAFEASNSFRAKREADRRKLKEARFASLPWSSSLLGVQRSDRLIICTDKDLLPQELWGVCGLAKGNRYWPKLMNKQSTLSTSEKLAKYSDDDEENAKHTDADATEENADDSDKDDDDKEKDEDAASQKDDDFEDDEDEMANDYNAEQYFDGGEDDGDEMGMDGGGGGDEW